MTDDLADIKRRLRIWQLLAEWQRLPTVIRDDIIGELEESAREVGDNDRIRAQARLVAADALEAIADPRTSLNHHAVAEDIEHLLRVIDQNIKPIG